MEIFLTRHIAKDEIKNEEQKERNKRLKVSRDNPLDVFYDRAGCRIDSSRVSNGISVHMLFHTILAACSSERSEKPR